MASRREQESAARHRRRMDRKHQRNNAIKEEAAGLAQRIVNAANALGVVVTLPSTRPSRTLNAKLKADAEDIERLVVADRERKAKEEAARVEREKLNAEMQARLVAEAEQSKAVEQSSKAVA